MSKINRIRAPFVALAVLLPAIAHAQLAVFDAANFSQMVQQVADDAQQLTELQNQLSAQLAMLKSLPGTVMPGVGQLISSTQNLMSSVAGIQYTASDLQNQLSNLYPTNFANESPQAILGSLGSMTDNTRQAYTDSMALQNKINQNQPQLQAAVQKAEAEGMAAPGTTAAVQSGDQVLGTMSAQLSQMQDTMTAAYRAQEQKQLERQSAAAANQQLVSQAWSDPEDGTQPPSVNPFPTTNAP